MKINKPHKFIYGDYITPFRTCICARREKDPIHIIDKNSKSKKTYKEGFDAGYIKGYKEGYKEGTLETIRYSLLNSLEGHSGKGEA